MSNTTAKRVTAMIASRAKEPIESLVQKLAQIGSPPLLSATVMEHVAHLALEMAAYYRSKANG
jgi:hypothetical protein